MHDPLLLRMLDLKTGRGRLVINSLQNAPQTKYAILLLQYLSALLVYFFFFQCKNLSVGRNKKSHAAQHTTPAIKVQITVINCGGKKNCNYPRFQKVLV